MNSLKEVIHLTGLPEKIRKTLEKVVAEMRAAENVYGIGLFGSWSRNDATTSSDVDLLILDQGSFSYEYVERIVVGGLLIDLDHVPKRWIHGPIPPELDQKLYEMQILYDRDWSLNDTKILMAKSYCSPERVDIRTETHVIDSDIYLSRATSAFSREDFRSAYFFATVALENILRVLVEIASEPFSNSRFIERLEASAAKLGMRDLFNEYLEVAELDEADDASARDKLRFFRIVWDEMKVTAKQGAQVLESSHFKVKTKLNYYLDPAFLQGVAVRTNFIVDSGKVVEACHYLNSVFLDIVENYVWLKSSIDKMKIDYTTLIRSLESLEEKNPKNYGYILKFLNLSSVTKPDAAGVIEKSREIILEVRKARKVLIKNYVRK
jgi:predicted nucleotidyltransferase